MLLDTKHRNIIRKNLKQIENASLNRRQKKRLLKELTKTYNNLKFKKEHIDRAYDSSSYFGLKDLEYTFGDLDDYYKPILAKNCFESNYQIYTIRKDKERLMYITEYLYTIRPYLVVLIDEKRSSNQKIQIDIAVNLIHFTKKDRITFYD